MSTLDLWQLQDPDSSWTIGARAEAAERAGWSGITLSDSQCRVPDPFLQLVVAAEHTKSLGLSSGVTNPYTRHPSVLANIHVSLQQLSGGRAVLSIGRGDSALIRLGLLPGRVSSFEEYTARLQTYLSGKAAPVDPADANRYAKIGDRTSDPDGLLGRLSFIDPSAPKVPLDIHSGGKRGIEVAARIADRVTLVVGADASRVKWGIEVAQAAREKAGLDPATLDIGVFISVVPYDDVAIARELVKVPLAGTMHVAAMLGTAHGPFSQDDRDVMAALMASAAGKVSHPIETANAETLAPDFIDRHAIVGPADICAARLHELAALGIKRALIIDAGSGARGGRLSEEARISREMLEKSVLPIFSNRGGD